MGFSRIGGRLAKPGLAGRMARMVSVPKKEIPVEEIPRGSTGSDQSRYRDEETKHQYRLDVHQRLNRHRPAQPRTAGRSHHASGYVAVMSKPLNFPDRGE